MVTFYLLFGILYGMGLLIMSKFWPSKIEVPSTIKFQKSVSILIPFRNEQNNLPTIYTNILNLEYRPIQVVFINDNSNDGGEKYLLDKIGKEDLTEIDLKVVPNKGHGKKEAIETGIDHAWGDFILVTDADCELPEDWVDHFLQGFEDEKIQLLAGPVINRESSSFLYRFQQIEWSSILLITYLGFYFRSPIMCSAANMAYRKEAFKSVGGYNGNAHFLSGDDEFLLKKVVMQYGGGAVGYLLNLRVWTKGESAWSRLIAQRSRWASKWKLHSSKIHFLISFSPFVIQFIFLLSPLLIFQGMAGVLLFLGLWIVKYLMEKNALRKVLEGFGIHHSRFNFLLVSLLHPVYVICVGIMANFGKIVWKGRNLVKFN